MGGGAERKGSLGGEARGFGLGLVYGQAAGARWRWGAEGTDDLDVDLEPGSPESRQSRYYLPEVEIGRTDTPDLTRTDGTHGRGERARGAESCGKGKRIPPSDRSRLGMRPSILVCAGWIWIGSRLLAPIAALLPPYLTCYALPHIFCLFTVYNTNTWYVSKYIQVIRITTVIPRVEQLVTSRHHHEVVLARLHDEKGNKSIYKGNRQPASLGGTALLICSTVVPPIANITLLAQTWDKYGVYRPIAATI